VISGFSFHPIEELRAIVVILSSQKVIPKHKLSEEVAPCEILEYMGEKKVRRPARRLYMHIEDFVPPAIRYGAIYFPRSFHNFIALLGTYTPAKALRFGELVLILV
jgi:hypothetical protein